MSSCLVGARWVSNLSVRPDWQETKKRKKSMQTNSNRRGLAIGAAFALVGSLFVAAPPSYATTDGQYIDIRPLSNAGTTTFGGLLTEDFPIYAQLKSGTSNASFSDALRWEVTHVSGAAPLVIVPANAGTAVGSTAGGLLDTVTATSTSEVMASFSPLANALTGAMGFSVSHTTSGITGAVLSANRPASVSAGIAKLFIRATTVSGSVPNVFSSTSPNSVFDVRAFIDDFGGSNGQYDVGEWFTTVRITLFATGNISTGVTVGSPANLDTTITASATAASVNWSNLDGRAFLQVSTSGTATFAGNVNATASSTISGLVATQRGGVFSQSFAVSALAESTTVSGQLRYASNGQVTVSSGVLIGAIVNSVVSAPAASALSVTASATANLAHSATSDLLIVRPNQTHTIRVLASTGSSNASVSTTVTVALSGATLESGTKMISVNGEAFTASYPTNISVVTGTDGVGTFTLATSGFVSPDAITISARVGNTAANPVSLRANDPVFTATAPSTHYVTTPGVAVTIPFSVRDQWGALSSRTDHFLRVTRGGAGFNYAETVSHVAITNGQASVVFTPAPAAASGSATVMVQSHRLLEGAYVALGTAQTTVNVTVTSSPMAFAAGLASSRAASVSYFADTVSWVTVTGNASAAGASIKVTGTDLVFRLSADFPATSSGTLNLNAVGSGAYSFQVTGLRPGTKTMTLVTGTATTTSLVVVADVGSDAGARITWDTTALVAGRTAIITGTLLDLNGNPVNTTAAGRNLGDSGTASIQVSALGTAGVVVGTTPTETDANGRFAVNVLTSAADSGVLTLTAVYSPQGASTPAHLRVTSVQAVTVAPAAPVEANAVIGSFNGRWAVRVENAKGSVVSVKAGNRWVKFSALNNNYLFSRKSVVGRTIAVSVWVDGELQNSQTITIK